MKSIIKFEHASMICWLVSDFSWMCDYPIVAMWILAVGLLCNLFFLILVDASNDEHLANFATFFWLLMSEMWLLHEITGYKILLLSGQVSFSGSIIIVIVLTVKNIPSIKRKFL